MNTLSSTGKSAKPAITSYISCKRRERVEEIFFLLAQYDCPISKNLRNVVKLPVDIQKSSLSPTLKNWDCSKTEISIKL